jgi:hypothetical membrane protein
MEKRSYALFGVFGPLVAYISIGVSILLSPWFSWESNALSDLGHAVKSEVASIFNFGLLLAGFLLMVYAVTAFRKHAKYTSICLLTSAFMIQLLATFDEVYGFLHYAVSVPHFIMLSITSIVARALRHRKKIVFSHDNFNNSSRFVGTVWDKNIQCWRSCTRNNLKNSHVMDHVFRHQNLSQRMNCLTTLAYTTLSTYLHERKKRCAH